MFISVHTCYSNTTLHIGGCVECIHTHVAMEGDIKTVERKTLFCHELGKIDLWAAVWTWYVWTTCIVYYQPWLCENSCYCKWGWVTGFIVGTSPGDKGFSSTYEYA